MTNSNTTTVRGSKQFAKKHAKLLNQGYTVAMPKVIGNALPKKQTFGDIIGAKLSGCDCDGKQQRHDVPILYASSGGEVMTPDNIGTPKLGYMEWGNGNKWPNVCALLTNMMPYTAAGWKFNTDLIAGLGPQPMYHYTQYVGGNITEKYIPFASAGILLRGWLRDLKLQQQQLQLSSSDANNSLPTGEGRGGASVYAEDIKQLEQEYATWHQTMLELTTFLANSDLQHIHLCLSADQTMFAVCFPEIQLSLHNADGKEIKNNADWKPKATGIRYHPAHTCRLERMDNLQRINHVYTSTTWYDDVYVEHKGAQTPSDLVAYPCLSPETPLQDLQNAVLSARSKKGINARPTRFIYPTFYPTPGRPYYPTAPWHSIFGGSIYELAATIVDDRYTRRKNSNVIGRVIYIHNEYLQQLWIQQDAHDKKTIDEIRDQLYVAINDWLSNSDNSGQSLLAFNFIVPSTGKEAKSFEIVEIESANKGTADANKTELQEISSIIFFAMGVDAKLIGNTPGDTSSGGGTEQRERFLLKQIQMSATQQIVLKPLNLISRFNDWDPHLEWQVRREVLTTLDNSKTGITTAKDE